MGEELSAAHAELAEIGIVLLMRLAECAENALDLGDVRFESLAVILDDHAFPIQGDQQPGCVCIDGIHGRFEAGLGEARGLPFDDVPEQMRMDREIPGPGDGHVRTPRFWSLSMKWPRSEERRGGKACDSTFSYRWSP